MKKFLPILFLFPLTLNAQLSESLLNKIRWAAEDYYITKETLSITCSKTLPCISVEINGHGPYDFLIDLGSNVVLFKKSVAVESGVDILIDRKRGDIVRAEKIKMGESVFLNVYGAAYDDLDVDGVIGFNLLGKTNFEMDYPNMEFSFIDDAPENLDGSFIKYETHGRMPYVKSKVGEKEIYVNFDTGATLWLYFPLGWRDSFALEKPLTEFKKMTNNQTGTTMTYTGKLKEDMTFGNFTVPSPTVVFDPDIEDAFVGSSFLCDFKLSFFPEIEMVKMARENKGTEVYIPDDSGKCHK